MPTSNLLDILLAHDLWASRLILQACADLSDEQFHRKFEMGPGSLHNAMTHVLAAMHTWADTLAGREQQPRLDAGGARRTPGELVGLLEEIAADFARSATSRPVEETVTRVREGKTFTYTRGVVVTHVATHGMHHRAQCLNMLRHLGVSPLPPSSVAEWSRSS